MAVCAAPVGDWTVTKRGSVEPPVCAVIWSGEYGVSQAVTVKPAGGVIVKGAAWGKLTLAVIVQITLPPACTGPTPDAFRQLVSNGAPV